MALIHAASGAVLVVLLVVMAASSAHADFHIVYWPTWTGVAQVQQLVLVPNSDLRSCNSVYNPNHWISWGSDYPSCNRGDVFIPNKPCGWTGAKIRPNCGMGGNEKYFGKLLGGSNEPVGDCYWTDSGNRAIIGPCCRDPCRADGLVFDRLTCYTVMCGSVNHDESS